MTTLNFKGRIATGTVQVSCLILCNLPFHSSKCDRPAEAVQATSAAGGRVDIILVFLLAQVSWSKNDPDGVVVQ